MKEHGVEKFGRLIDQNIAQAAYLSSLIETEPTLELAVPTNINIVCYRYTRPGADREAIRAINTEIMLRLQEEGIAGNRSHPPAVQAAAFAGIVGRVRLARAAAMRDIAAVSDTTIHGE